MKILKSLTKGNVSIQPSGSLDCETLDKTSAIKNIIRVEPEGSRSRAVVTRSRARITNNSRFEGPDGTSAITNISLVGLEGTPSGNVVMRSRATTAVRSDAGLSQLWEATDRHVYEIEEQLAVPSISEKRPGKSRQFETGDLGRINGSGNGFRSTQPEVHFNHPQTERRERIAQLASVAIEMFLASRGVAQ
jgi:hypothetical protein